MHDMYVTRLCAAGKLKSLSDSIKGILPGDRRRQSLDAKAEHLRRISEDSRVHFATDAAPGASEP